MDATVNALLEVLRKSPDVYDFGTSMAIPSGRGKMQTINQDTVGYTVACNTQFWKKSKPTKDGVSEVLLNPPKDVTMTLMGLAASRGLRPLDAVISAPLMRPDGSILNKSGYDTSTRLLLDMEDVPQHIPLNPNSDQIKAALNRLWAPFRMFPFVGENDRAVLLAALLTAIQRPILGKAPAFAFDANQHGSGKSALAECVSVMTTGEKATPWPDVKDESETRKRLMALLRDGRRVLLWDNVMGALNSASLAAFLTSESYGDRVLNVSGGAEYPNRVMTLFTGNNFTPSGELPRRVLTARLDAGMERPWSRRFDFDPVATVLANRQALVAAGLTLLAGFVAAGRPEQVPAPLGTFEQWDALIRQCVIWVGNQPDMDIGIGDPVQSVIDRAGSDPIAEANAALLALLLEVYEGKTFTARDIAATCENARLEGPNLTEHAPGRKLLDAFGGFIRHKITSESVGSVLRFRKDNNVEGMRLETTPFRENGSAVWQVRCLPD